MSTSIEPSEGGVVTPSALLDLDTDLLSDVRDPERRRLALEAVVADELWLDPGDQLDVAAIARGQGLGVLIMSGFICREVAVADRVSADLAGPEDLLSLAPIALPDDMFPATVSFVALGPVRLAVLDNAFCARAAPWPEILRVLVERARRPGDRSAHVRAIARSAGIEVRLLLSLWYWASWWSSVLPDGLRLAVPLSHERLAHLLGATRPTITTAVGRLRRAGYVAQPAEGVWLLRDSPNGAAAVGDGELPLDSARVRVPPQFSPGAKVRSPWDLRTAKRSDVYARLAAQRELLRAAADRHAAQLMRLKDGSEKLRATTELSELARQARDWRDDDPGHDAGEAV
jgi:CRP-like cAMP-binding protein